MSFCEKCGKIIKQGEVFCETCITTIKKNSVPSSLPVSTDKEIEHELFSFKSKYSSKWIRLLKLFPYLIGTLIIVLGMIPIFTDSVELTISQSYFYIIGISISFIVILSLFKRSEQNLIYFLAILVLVMTLGGGVIFSTYIDTIYPLGVTLSCLLLILPHFQQKSRKIGLILEFFIIIITLGLGSMFSDYNTIIFPVSFILIGLLVMITKF